MTLKKMVFEIQDNFLPVRDYMPDPFSAEAKTIATAIANAIYTEEVYRAHLASLENDIIKWCDSLALYARAVLFRWRTVAGAWPANTFKSIGYDACEACVICSGIDEQIKKYLED